MLDNFLRDIAYALRTMRKSPAFSLTAVLTLALGIGCNTAMFTVIRAVLLKPLEYRDPDRLVSFALGSRKGDAGPDTPFSAIRLGEMRAAAKSFTAIGAFLGSPEDVTLSAPGEPEALKGARVSGNFLDILGVQPILGRGFLSDEDRPGGPSVAMIGETLWRRRFDADRHITGRTVTLDAKPCTIVGVLPAGFAFPLKGVDVWMPRPSEWSVLAPRYWPWVNVLTGFARLKPGITLEQAAAEMEVLNRQYLLAHPGTRLADLTMRVDWMQDRLVANVRPMLWTLFGAVGFVLLIACSNVASLLLARATSRSRELAARAALGAGRGRLIRQLLAESVVLAIAGGVLGAFLGKWGLDAITRIGDLPLPRSGEIRLDGVVLGFTVLLSIATGVLFGLFPSLSVSRPDLAGVLREGGAAAGRSAGTSTRGLLVVSQVALSVVLLIGAALLIESFARLNHVDPGFNPARLLTMRIALPPARYDSEQKRAAFFTELARRVEAMPGVKAAAMAMSLPTTRWIFTNVVQVEGGPLLGDNEPHPVVQSVTPGYLRTLGIPLRRGREFTARDNTPGAPRVAMINESLARGLWPAYPAGPNPVGLRFQEGYDKAAGWLEIVGIVADVHEGGVWRTSPPEFYLPTVVHPPQTAYLAVRTEGDPLRSLDAIRNQVIELDRYQPVSDVKPMQTVLDEKLGQRRLTMLLLGGFAGVALLLAMIGIYGVIAYSVAQRVQEVGIRRALGAQQGDILKLMLRQGLYLAMAGVLIGVGGAWALTRTMTSLLFEVSATDPWTFVGIAVLFIVVALAASLLPARRAARIDPMAALRVG